MWTENQPTIKEEKAKAKKKKKKKKKKTQRTCCEETWGNGVAPRTSFPAQDEAR